MSEKCSNKLRGEVGHIIRIENYIEPMTGNVRGKLHKSCEREVQVTGPPHPIHQCGINLFKCLPIASPKWVVPFTLPSKLEEPAPKGSYIHPSGGYAGW
ncbi:hypothetical protein CEXT_483721 [Caerostris extrusa]|uniref:Uncharacterized protein n=1 Tax=Caerostris extrusa TaxID=172846 RepID=A0AAV4VMQ4_CAEEX|nr:hypothetical protein CEXT_483721 [Caerostris extrusa]